MALQLMKIALDGVITTNVVPNSEMFFYVTTEETEAGDTLTIDAADFMQNDGEDTDQLPELTDDNSYYTVNINGIPQMQDLTTYTPGETGEGSLAIDVPADGPSIGENSPIVLHVINYAPTSDGDFIT